MKEHRESFSITKRKRSTLILECKELLLKHYGTLCIILRPPDTVKGVYWDLNTQKYEILQSGVRSPLDSLDVQNMVLEMTLQDCTVLASSRNTKINRTSLIFHRQAC